MFYDILIHLTDAMFIKPKYNNLLTHIYLYLEVHVNSVVM